MKKYQIKVDRTICIACGVAPSMCPQIFMLGKDNGKNSVIAKYSQQTSEDTSLGIVSEDLYDCARQAVDACPVQAITIEEI